MKKSGNLSSNWCCCCCIWWRRCCIYNENNLTILQWNCKFNFPKTRATHVTAVWHFYFFVSLQRLSISFSFLLESGAKRGKNDGNSKYFTVFRLSVSAGSLILNFGIMPIISVSPNPQATAHTSMYTAHSWKRSVDNAFDVIVCLFFFYSPHFRMISNLLDGIVVCCSTDIIWLPLSFFCLFF